MFTNDQKRIFRSMINDTRSCLKNSNANTHAKQVACENALFSYHDAFTYHTHPNGVLEPSPQDIKTTARHKKKVLAIGLVPSNEVIVWGPYPKYNKIVARFTV